MITVKGSHDYSWTTVSYERKEIRESWRVKFSIDQTEGEVAASGLFHLELCADREWA